MAWLQCEIYPGQFSSELAVIVKSSAGLEFSLFSDKGDLRYDNAPTRDHPVHGWIAVEIVECEQDLFLVRLPQTTLENGQYLTVMRGDLSEKVTNHPGLVPA